MKIAIVNDIHFGKTLEYKGKVRASSHLVEKAFPSVLQLIEERHEPDLLVHLGDLIRSESKEKDLLRMKEMLKHFQGKSFPVIHLLGNHEIKCLTSSEIEQLWNDMGISQRSFGKLDLHGYRLLWLGLESNPDNQMIRYVPAHQVEWLNQELRANDRPVLLFTHCAIDDHNVRGNFFYEASERQCRDTLFVQNQDEVQEILSQSNGVQAVFQAHLHYFHTSIRNQIPHITCPALADNICGMDLPEIPAVYTIVSIDHQELTVKAYSGEHAFAGSEFCLN